MVPLAPSSSPALAPIQAATAATHRLVLLNDPETVYAYAVAALEAVFGVPRLDAERAVQHAHEHGRCPLAQGRPEGLAPAMDLLGRLASHAGQVLRVAMEPLPSAETVIEPGFVPEVIAEKI